MGASKANPYDKCREGRLESNPSATGAAPDGNEDGLPLAVPRPRQARLHGLSAADLSAMGVSADFWYAKNRQFSPRTSFYRLLLSSPHIL